MRTFVNVIGITMLFTVLVLALHLGAILWLLFLVPCLFGSILLITIGADSNYWAYRNKTDFLLTELEAEKEAYILAKESMEQTGLLLGNILVEKKENY
jgi:hypothetical protein